jgi:hypothetical protein
MNRYLLIFFLLFSKISFSQVKIGLYNESSDTVYIAKGWILFYSTLTINQDSTFTYSYKSSTGCLTWYDIKGNWSSKRDTLYLTDSMPYTDQAYKRKIAVRTTVFQVINNELKYISNCIDSKIVKPYIFRNFYGKFVWHKPTFTTLLPVKKAPL